MAIRQDHIVRKFVPNFDQKTIEDLVMQRGKGAKVFLGKCINENCGKKFMIMAYQVQDQYKKYNKFIPPTLCRACFEIARNTTVPSLPANATLDQTVQQTLADHKKKWWDFVKLRRGLEGRLVTVSFKDDAVSAANFGKPEEVVQELSGTLVALGKLGLSLMVYPERSAYNALTYPRDVITNIELTSEDRLIEPPVEEKLVVSVQPVTVAAAVLPEALIQETPKKGNESTA